MDPSIYKMASIGAGCMLSGFVAGYLWCNRTNTKHVGDEDILIQKTYENLPHLDRRIDEYIVRNSTQEPQALVELREMTLKQFPGEPMIIDPIEAKFFQILIKTLDAKKCMEVGGYTGYNAASMALALPEDGSVVVSDITDEYINAGRPFIENLGARVWSKLDIHIRPAFETMDYFISKGDLFDFIFLDAEWNTCLEYYEKALMLVRSGGIVAIDNTLCSGRVTFGAPFGNIHDVELREEVEALNSMNEFLKTDERIELVFLKIADGVTICRKV